MKLTELDSTPMMAVKPSTSSSPSPFPLSFLSIDLNEFPSSLVETLHSPSDTTRGLSPTTLVRGIHQNRSIPEGQAAEIPEGDAVCGVCGTPAPEETYQRLVCDGCETGFHFECTGGATRVGEEEWLCRFCVEEGVSSKRWRIGRRTEEREVRLIDVNASPPREGDAEPMAMMDDRSR